MSWFNNNQAPSELPANALLIDVRSEGEFAGGHVEGAIPLPLDRFIQEIGQVAPDKDQPLVLYCLSGARSGSACAWLMQQGYTQVTNGGSASAVAMQLQRPIVRRG